MKTAQDIYTEYKIMPSLQLHQLRVAAVGKYLCEHAGRAVDAEDVILACLFHDMGNIIKFDLSYFPEFVEPRGIEYWAQVKTEYVQKYGTDHHAANVAIAREIGLPPSAIAHISTVGFSKAEEILASDSLEKKLCNYADARVGPHGVLPLEERIQDGRKRYLGRSTASKMHIAESPEHFEKYVQALHALEKQIFASADIGPADINDGVIRDSVEELRDYTLA